MNLHDILKENAIELVPSSQGRWVAVCPFHKGDRDPSFTIYPTQTYFCFGCGEWGDAVKFLVDYKGMSSKEAMDYVGDDYKALKADKSQVIKVQHISRIYEFLYDCAETYWWFGKQTPGPLKYLNSRGISEATVDEYRIGYSDGRVLSFKYAHEYALGKETGLISSTGYEAMSHRITIPNITDRIYCDFMIGRTVTNDHVKYLGVRMPKPIFGFWEVRHSPIIFLAEGQFDWLLLRQYGYPAAVIGGTHLTKSNRALLRNKKIVIVPDNDEPGKESARLLKQAFGVDAVILDYTSLGVKDVGELEADEEKWKQFKTLVLEQVPWLTTSISKRTLEAFFPNLISMTPSLST